MHKLLGKKFASVTKKKKFKSNLQPSSNELGRPLLFTSFFPFFPRPCFSVEQNVNVSALFVVLPIPTLICGWNGAAGAGGGGVGRGIFIKRGNCMF